MEKTAAILQPYIFSEFGSETHEIPYCFGSITYDFTGYNSPKFITQKVGLYESKIENFINRDFGSQQVRKNDILILIGGIGTGKSTALRRCYNNILNGPRKCSHSIGAVCSNKPIYIKFDFNDLEGGDTTDNGATIDDSEKLWNFISACISDISSDDSLSEEEIVYFWKWCLSQSRILGNSIHLNKFFSGNSRNINDFLDESIEKPKKFILETLINSRKDFFINYPCDAIAWYRIFYLAYSLHKRKNDCNCLHMFFDNVDHLNPILQKNTVKFSILITSILCARTIVCIRPLTWERTIHGHILLQEELHYSPGVCEVIAKRMDECIKNEVNLRDDQRKAIEKLRETFMPNEISGKIHYSFLSQLIEITSGISLRFALRNFCNMLASPLILSQPLGEKFLKDIKISEITRALFFSDLDRINEDAFDNIYLVNGMERNDQILIKPRILDFLKRFNHGVNTISAIFNFLENFSYNKNYVLTALNELLRPTRPLLWSEDGYKVENPESKSRILLTPIGYRYIENLYGELYYDEVCLAQNTFDSVKLETIYEFHKRLTDQDIHEIKACVDNCGTINYESYYPHNTRYASMSLIHWKKLAIGLSKRDEKYGGGTFEFDIKREHWISSQVENCLKCQF